jgi:hypothetical protein
MGTMGPPLRLACTATNVRKIKASLLIRYTFRFEQEGEVVYEGDQSALWARIEETAG